MKNAKEQYLHVHDDFLRRRTSKNSNSASINLIHQLRIFLATTCMHTQNINVIELFYISVGWTKLIYKSSRRSRTWIWQILMRPSNMLQLEQRCGDKFGNVPGYHRLPFHFCKACTIPCVFLVPGSTVCPFHLVKHAWFLACPLLFSFLFHTKKHRILACFFFPKDTLVLDWNKLMLHIGSLILAILKRI